MSAVILRVASFNSGVVLALIQVVQTRRAGKHTGIKTGIRSFAGLCLVGCCLLIPLLSAKSQPFGGLLTVSGVNFNGNPVTVDSFDSSDPTKSLWQTNLTYNGTNYGFYSSSRRTADAIVGTDSSIFNLGNAQIYGFVDTAPGGGVSIQRNGSVGDLAWVGSGISGIQTVPTNHLRDDMNMVFNDVVLPTPTNPYYPAWLSPAYFPSGTNIGGTIYYYVITNIMGPSGALTNKIYYILNPVLGQASIFIDASNVVLYLTNGISMQTGNALTLNTNSSVEIYSGSTFNAGNGLVNNLTQYAPALKVFGLRNCTSIAFGGNAVLTTWLYAPEASLAFNGGGSFTYNVVGALTCHDVEINGHYNFHFDEGLGAYSPPWIITQPANQIVHVGSNAVFNVSVGGFPLGYRWYRDPTSPNLLSTNGPSLTMTNVQPLDARNYFVVVSNLYGSTRSTVASLVVYTNATPTLSVDAASTNGQFQFDVSGVTGLNYSVQASTNLIYWVPLMTNVSPFSFVDTNAVLFPQRFYRSVFTQ